MIISDTRHGASCGDDISKVVQQIKNLLGGNRIGIFLLDSGNLVREPISGKYVILVGIDAAMPLLSAEEIRALREGDAEFLLRRRFRLICATGVDGVRRTLYGFAPKKIVLTDGKRQAELDAYIAVSPTERGFGGFDGIAHPSLIA